MNISTKLLQAAAGSAGGDEGVDVDNVFSTFLYDGNASTQAINNGVALGSVITEVALTGKTITNLGSSFEGSYPLSNVNDGTVETSNGQNTAYTTGTFDIYVDMGLAVIVDAYLLAPQGDQGGSTYNNPTGLTVSGSNNASSWTTITTFSSISGFSPGTFKTFEFSNTTAYRYYRLAATNTGVSISEWKVRTNDNTGSGGLIWIKNRSSSSTNNRLFDTSSGAIGGTSLRSNLSNGLHSFSGGNKVSVTSTGFSLNSIASQDLNDSSDRYVSWTWRKAPRFFDIQTWTGNSASDRAISHNLNSVPGMIIVKRLNSSEDWGVWHRDVHENTTKVLYLNKTDALSTSTSIFGATNPTSTNFYVGNHPVSNNNGDTYVAYIFAHNNGDGDFGPNKDQDVIKCGVFSTDSSGNATVDLGFEPQWLMVKATNAAYGWEIYDQMRGFGVSGHSYLFAHLANAEGSNTTAGTTQPTNTGFSVGNNYWGPGTTLIYMAIRRGPLAEPTDATKVFAIDTAGGGPPTFTSGFPVDMSIFRNVGGSDWNLFDRVRGDTKELNTNSSAAESSNAGTYYNQDLMTGIGSNSTNTDTDAYQWMWKREPGYFDVVAYQGTGSAGFTFNHNLGVKPEMIWVKNRGASEYWAVYHKDLNGGTNPSHYYLKLNDTNAEFDYNEIWNDTEPTATQVTVGQQGVVNSGSFSHIAYLFATVAGVSKVGSYSGTGSTQTIDCGFSSGARFVLIKCTNDAENWIVFDSQRGIVSGNDPYLALNTTDAENTSSDFIDPVSSGFAVNTNSGEVNNSSNTYIFYAIA